MEGYSTLPAKTGMNTAATRRHTWAPGKLYSQSKHPRVVLGNTHQNNNITWIQHFEMKLLGWSTDLQEKSLLESPANHRIGHKIDMLLSQTCPSLSAILWIDIPSSCLSWVLETAPLKVRDGNSTLKLTGNYWEVWGKYLVKRCKNHTLHTAKKEHPGGSVKNVQWCTKCHEEYLQMKQSNNCRNWSLLQKLVNLGMLPSI